MAAGRRVVVKVGTRTLCGALDRPDPWFMAALADEICDLWETDHQVILVTSGAMGTGQHMLGLSERPRELRLKQVCAAVGQARLVQDWAHAFGRRQRHVAQVLLTYRTFARRSSYLDMREAMQKMLDLGVVPIINENDVVSVAEIDDAFGDNDRLSALVATKLEADLLVILSDVDGLYSRPPGHPEAVLVPRVEAITDEVRAMAGRRAGSTAGTGGMATKLAAAEMAMAAGTEVVIVHGRTPRVLQRVVAGDGDLGTRFVTTTRAAGAARWLAVARPQGRIGIDAGAAAALRDGRHLLPAGVLDVDGEFDVESPVALWHDGRQIGLAISEFSARDLREVKGLASADVRQRLALTGSVNITRKGQLVLHQSA